MILPSVYVAQRTSRYIRTSSIGDCILKMSAQVASSYSGTCPELRTRSIICQADVVFSDPVHIAVIGGTGISHLPHFTHVASLNVDTPWGKPSSPISILHHPSPTTGKPVPIAFLSRHGLHHEYAPHEVPVRANIAALRSIGVRTIIAFSAVGSLQERSNHVIS